MHLAHPPPRASHVTPLTFHSFGGRRRRLATTNSQAIGLLHGNLNTLGYFAADICLGSPPTSFDLIVDTGSALTALPCADCQHCGAHTHGPTHTNRRYNISTSTSGRAINCGSDQCPMHRCTNGDECVYSLSFTEGSSIRGHMVEETFWFSKADGRTVPVSATFGCLTSETGLFKTQVADGITGFSRSSHFGNTLFQSLRAAHADAQDIFSVCLSQTVGAMVLGGTLPANSSSVQWIPTTTSTDTYGVDLVDIRIDGVSIGASAASYRTTIFDTGTTFMYLPPAAYAAVRAHWQSHCPWGACTARAAHGEYPDDYCYTMSHEEMLRFSPHSLHFHNGVSMAFGPAQYAYELRSGVWCLGIFDNQHNGAVIGAASVRDYEVLFDNANARVGFVPSNCDGMHRGVHSSVLLGGFGLSACSSPTEAPASPSTEAAAPPPPPVAPDEAAADRQRADGHGRARASGDGGYLTLLSDEAWLLANTTSWTEFAKELEHLHPGMVAAIALGSMLCLVCCVLVGACYVRVRLRRMAKEYDERLRLVRAGQELTAFDEPSTDPRLDDEL